MPAAVDLASVGTPSCPRADNFNRSTSTDT